MIEINVQEPYQGVFMGVLLPAGKEIGWGGGSWAAIQSNKRPVSPTGGTSFLLQIISTHSLLVSVYSP